ncbi:MAG: orotidine-5'-phosphate decarboxylase, partial [Patescibacteria group bacterium]|nr:orotidine-5'-phosphate decarboxylase [Patescibacteria group bacterium]
MNFFEKLKKIIEKNKSLIAIGLDTDIKKIPIDFKRKKDSQYYFNKHIIDNTFDLVCSYKLNTAFYEAIGYNGIYQLKLTIDYLRQNYPQIPLILDAKRADIENTNQKYADFVFNYLKADGITVNPYLGIEPLKPFLEKKDKGIFILCKTSNPGSNEFQNLEIKIKNSSTKYLYEYIAYKISKIWNKNKNCGLVVGATYYQELKRVREIIGDKIFILVPGIGSQGGDLKKTLKAGLNSKNQGLIIN